MNKVILIGRLVANPELKSANTPNGPISYCNFTLAVKRQFQANNNGQPDSDFIDCIIWRAQAENLCKFKKQGDELAVEGSIQVNSYDDAQGIRRKGFKVVCSSCTFLRNKLENGDQSYSQNNYNNGYNQGYNSGYNQNNNRGNYQNNYQNNQFNNYGQRPNNGYNQNNAQFNQTTNNKNDFDISQVANDTQDSVFEEYSNKDVDGTDGDLPF